MHSLMVGDKRYYTPSPVSDRRKGLRSPPTNKEYPLASPTNRC